MSPLWTTQLSVRSLSIYFAEHDIHGTDDGDEIGDHVVLGDLVESGQVSETWRTNVTSVRATRTVRDQVDAHLAFRRLDGRVSGTWWHLEAFGEELKVVNERLHGFLKVTNQKSLFKKTLSWSSFKSGMN